MKPLGKAMKAAHYNRVDKGQALKQLLCSYRSTPHPSTGESPGAVIFRSGYRTEVPQQVLSDDSVKAAFQFDQKQKCDRGEHVNASKHRMPSALQIGDIVYVRNRKTSKFQPDFGPETYTIITLENGGATLLSTQSNNSTIYRRHLDDLKQAPKSSETENITWFPPPLDAPTPFVQEPPLQDIVPEVVVHQQRPRRETRRPGHLDNYVVEYH